MTSMSTAATRPPGMPIPHPGPAAPDGQLRRGRQAVAVATPAGHAAPAVALGVPPGTFRARDDRHDRKAAVDQPRAALGHEARLSTGFVVKLRLPELLVVDIDDDPKQPEPLIFGHALKIISLGVNDVFAGSFGGGLESRLFLLLGGFHRTRPHAELGQADERAGGTETPQPRRDRRQRAERPAAGGAGHHQSTGTPARRQSFRRTRSCFSLRLQRHSTLSRNPHAPSRSSASRPPGRRTRRRGGRGLHSSRTGARRTRPTRRPPSRRRRRPVSRSGRARGPSRRPSGRRSPAPSKSEPSMPSRRTSRVRFASGMPTIASPAFRPAAC